MKTSRIIVLTCSLLAVAATGCGGSGSNAETVAQSVIDSATEQGVDLDEDCIRKAVTAIPEADLQIMVDNLAALDSGDANVDTIGISAEGLDGLNAIFECVTGN